MAWLLHLLCASFAVTGFSQDLFLSAERGYVPCTGNSINLSRAECNFWQDLYISTKGDEWHFKCPATDPCNCGFGNSSAFSAAAVDCGPTGTNIRSLRISGLCCVPGHPCDFKECTMSGSLPASIGDLAEMTNLRLNNNDLRGEIPVEIAKLKKLQNIDLDSNNFTGLVPPLPFSQYRTCEFLGNQPFTCPLPPHADQCKCCGGIPGVTCYNQSGCRIEMAASSCHPTAPDCWNCLNTLKHNGKIHCEYPDIKAYCNGECARTQLAAGPLKITSGGHLTTVYVGVSGGTSGESAFSSGNSLTIKNPTGPRSYLVNTCVESSFQPNDFVRFELIPNGSRSGRISFLVDLSGAGCGCNAAVYLTSMPAIGADGKFNQTGGDFYCDSGGKYAHCPEIDLMEANRYAFSATPHRCVPSTLVAGHYESCDNTGCCQNTKTMASDTYGPGSSFIIDTTQPFHVNTTFSVTVGRGAVSETEELAQIETVLWQQGGRIVRLAHNDNTCGAGYIAALSSAVRSGMSLVATNWGGPAGWMSWLDEPPCNSSTNCGSNELRVSDIVVESF